MDLGVALIEYPEHYDLAEDLLKRNVTLENKSHNLPSCPHQALGLLYYKQGEVDLALEHWNMAVHNAEEKGHLEHYKTSLASMISIYIERGDYQRAITCLHQYRDNAQRNSELLFYGDRLSLAKLHVLIGS